MNLSKQALASKYDPGYYVQPRQDLNKGELIKLYGSIENWYAYNVKDTARLWNVPYNIGYRLQPGLNNNINPITKPIAPVDEIYTNFLYYKGKQQNFNYAFLEVSEDGQERPATWTQGQKIAELINNITGRVRDIMEVATWTVKSTNKEIENKRDRKLQAALVKEQLRPMFDQLKGLGVSFSPLPKEGFKSEEEIEGYINDNLYVVGEQLGLNFIRVDTSTNDFVAKAERSFRNCTVGKYCARWVYVHNGVIYEQDIAPWALILDKSIDDDYNLYSRKIGIIEFLTPDEIFAKYEFPDVDERNDVISMATINANDTLQLWGAFNINPANNFMWWQTDGFGVRRIACVTAYWKSYYNPRGKRTIDFNREVIHTATLIGNKYLKNYDLDDNIVRSPLDRSEPVFPIIPYIPQMTLGTNECIVDRIRNKQDDVDAIEYIIKTKISRDLGKCYIVYAPKLQGVNTSEMISDFKRLGLHVINHSGEIDDLLNRERAVETVDFTADPNLMVYWNVKKAYEAEMEEISAFSKTTLGQQTTYMSKDQISQQNASSSVGQSSLIKGFAQWLINVQQYKLEKLKILALTPEGKKYAESFLSESQMKYLDIIRDFSFNDLRIKVDIEDFLDQQLKMRLLSYAQAWSQNPAETGVTPAAILRLETSKTLTELIDYFDKLQVKNEEAKAQKEQMMMQMQQQQQQQQMALQAGMVQQKEQGQNFRNENDNQTALAETMIKEGVKAGQQPAADI